MSYHSPITIIQDMCTQIEEQREDAIVAKVREIIDVDKEELRKALAYDRDQYMEGYKDGLEEGKRLAMQQLAKSILDKYGSGV